MPQPAIRPSWLPNRPPPKVPYWPAKSQTNQLPPVAAALVRKLPKPSTSQATGRYTPRSSDLPRLKAIPLVPQIVHVPLFKLSTASTNDGPSAALADGPVASTSKLPLEATAMTLESTGVSSQATPIASSSEPDFLVPLPSRVFDAPHRPTLLHHLIVSHLASLRHTQAVNKDRGQTAGSGCKIHPQKGTGRARMKDRRNPIRRGGGRAFPKTLARNWTVGILRRAWVQGMRNALSLRWRDGSLTVVDGFPTLNGEGVEATRNGVTSIAGRGPVRETGRLVHKYGIDSKKSAIFLVSDAALSKDAPPATRLFLRSVAILPKFEVKRAIDVDVVDVLKYGRLFFDIDGISELVAKLESERGLLGHYSRPLVADAIVAKHEALSAMPSQIEEDEADWETVEEVEAEAQGLVNEAEERVRIARTPSAAP